MSLCTKRLGEVGAIHVTTAAARSFATFARVDLDLARHGLAALLVNARQTHAAIDGTPARWRARSRSNGVDVTARVVPQGGRMVVVSASVRPYGRPPSYRRRQSKRGRSGS